MANSRVDANNERTLIAFDGTAIREVLCDSAGRLSVAVASGTITATVTEQANTATLTNVAGSASSVTLKAANTGRLGLEIFNDSTSALYVKFGATASTTSFTVKMAAGAYYEVPDPIYTGVVDGIWDTATGSARVTELTNV